MDVLRAEINRKKKTNGDIIDAVNPEARIGHTRFVRQGLSVEQVKQRLRVLRHPITLFGETDDDRRQRLIRIQSEEQQDDDFRLGSGHNLPNTFLNRRGGAS
eukprot:gene12320-16589_t